MTINRALALRAALLVSLIVNLTIVSDRMQADTGTCGGTSLTLPFTDVSGSNIFFCSIAAAFFSGLTNGTSPTTYNPADPVPREQMAAFITRTMDQSLRRGNKRAALKKWYTSQPDDTFGLTTTGSAPTAVAFDGADLWVANQSENTVSRVRASDGKLLETWTGANQATDVLIAKGRVFVIGKADFNNTTPGSLYMIDPTQPAGDVTVVTNSLDPNPSSLAFDGSRIWVACKGTGGISPTGTVNIVTPISWTIAPVTGFFSVVGIVYDGNNMWITDNGSNKLYKLNSNGSIAQTITVPQGPLFPLFDGTNIWVPCKSPFAGQEAALTIVRAVGQLSGTVLATFTTNVPINPRRPAFDGERVLIADFSSGLYLYKATDFTFLGFAPTPSGSPFGACSDGLDFWVTLFNPGKLSRF